MKLFLLIWAFVSSVTGFYLYQETLRLEKVADGLVELAFEATVHGWKDHQELKRCRSELELFCERRSL